MIERMKLTRRSTTTTRASERDAQHENLNAKDDRANETNARKNFNASERRARSERCAQHENLKQNAKDDRRANETNARNYYNANDDERARCAHENLNAKEDRANETNARNN